MRRRWWLGLGLGAVLAVGVAGWAVLLRPAAAPSAEAGRVWLEGFVDKLLRRETWGAKGPAALALFPELGAWDGQHCVLSWTRREPRAAVVLYESLELGRLAADPCEQAQFGMLSVTLRPSEGITAGALAERLNERFGPAEMHRDAIRGGSVTYQWQLQDGVFVHVDESARAENLGEFSVLFVRSYAAPATIPTAAEAEHWMDETVSLLTGPALAQARGMAAVRLAGVPMVAYDSLDGGCPRIFNADLRQKGPIAADQSVMLEPVEGRTCDEARLSSLSMRIWSREPVTAKALVERLDARLGATAVSRDFKWDTVNYRWSAPGGMVVELLENEADGMRQILLLRAWQPDR